VAEQIHWLSGFENFRSRSWIDGTVSGGLSELGAMGADREALAVLEELCLQALNLGSEHAVLRIGVLRGRRKLFDLGLKIVKMLFLAFSKRPLGSSVLGLALLKRREPKGRERRKG